MLETLYGLETMETSLTMKSNFDEFPLVINPGGYEAY